MNQKPTLPITVNTATATDIDVIVNLLGEQMAGHRIDSQPAILRHVVTEVIDQKTNGFLFVARLDQEIIGVAYVAIILSAEHGGWSGWLEELYVAPGHRDKGAGRALLEAVIAEARARKMVALDLEVDFEHKRVESLYKRFGFQPMPRTHWVKKL